MAAVLGSWKEIASFLGKGVRTVQRWERDLGLPVHRPPGREQGVVIAFPGELTNWAKRQSSNGDVSKAHRAELDRIHELSASVLSRSAKLHATGQQLISTAAKVMERMRESQELRSLRSEKETAGQEIKSNGTNS